MPLDWLLLDLLALTSLIFNVHILYALKTTTASRRVEAVDEDE